MTRLKHYFYLSSAVSSGICLFIMFVLILLQIVARLTGNVIPSSEDFSGWLLSATIFFGLAYTFKQDGHIRMTMFLAKVSSRKRFIQDCINLFIALFIGGFFTFYSLTTVYESYSFGDVTDTYVVLPLWIIQIPMALGSLFLFIALIDNLIETIGKKSYFIAQHIEDK